MTIKIDDPQIEAIFINEFKSDIKAFTKALDEQLLIDTMLSKVPKKVHEANLKAYELGKKYALEAMNK